MTFDIDSLDIDNGASGGGGGFFKPGEHTTATVIIFEPKGSKKSQYADERTGEARYNAVADFTVFSTKAELKNGKPGVVLEDAQTSGVLGSILIEKGKGITVGTVSQTEGKGGRRGYWKIDPVDPALIPDIKKYLAKREEERNALPDFMD